MTSEDNVLCGCRCGKCLGGAIGMAYEGVPRCPSSKAADVLLQDVPNDDLDRQLIRLRAMERFSGGLEQVSEGDVWLENISEHAIALRNMRRGREDSLGTSHLFRSLGYRLFRPSRCGDALCCLMSGNLENDPPEGIPFLCPQDRNDTFSGCADI